MGTASADRRADARPVRECPSCGSPAGPSQAYCLECGSRLGRAATPREAATVWRGGGTLATEWVWPALAALVVAVGVATVAVAFRVADSDAQGDEALVATLPQATLPVEEAVVPTTEDAPPAAEPAPPPAAEPPAPQRRGGLVEWPAGRDGWTVVLASLPRLAGREAAVGRAKAAIDAGIADVGILDTEEYSSFHPDYYVVFSGVHRTQPAAERASRVAHDKGYRDAYPREVTR